MHAAVFRGVLRLSGIRANCPPRLSAQLAQVRSTSPTRRSRARSSKVAASGHQLCHCQGLSDQGTCVTRAEMAIDPVCGMQVNPATAKHQAEHDSKTSYFCSARCREKFIADPQAYLGSPPAPASAAAPTGTLYICPMHPEVQQVGPGNCPKCGMALEPMLPSTDADDGGELASMTRRFWILVVLTVPVSALMQRHASSVRYLCGRSDRVHLAGCGGLSPRRREVLDYRFKRRSHENPDCSACRRDIAPTHERRFGAGGHMMNGNMWSGGWMGRIRRLVGARIASRLDCCNRLGCHTKAQVAPRRQDLSAAQPGRAEVRRNVSGVGPLMHCGDPRGERQSDRENGEREDHHSEKRDPRYRRSRHAG